MAKLTHGVEIELQKHMSALQNRMEEAVDTIRGLEPHIDFLRARLTDIEDHVSVALERPLKETGDVINNNIQGAANLQQMIASMIREVLEGTSHVAAARERSVQLAKQNSEDNSYWTQELSNAAASIISINNQLVRAFISSPGPFPSKTVSM